MSFDFSQATERISASEGKREHVYVDTMGHPTVGVGFNLDRTGAAAQLEAVSANYEEVRAGTQALTDDQITTLLKGDIETALGHAESAVSNFGSLTAARQFVIVDMIFNLGTAGFGQFHHVISAIEAGDWETAGEQMQASAWYGQVGHRAQEDVKMMKGGGWDGAAEGPPSAGAAGSAEAAPAPSHSGPPHPGHPLKLHDSGDEVKTWQERLAALGHDASADGEFGHHTEEATKQFQSSKGLEADGIVGEHTWAAAWS
jgi:GH24 family phage-related lysozyme (muramidase)